MTGAELQAAREAMRVLPENMAKALEMPLAEYERMEDEDDKDIPRLLAMAVTHMVEHPEARPQSEVRSYHVGEAMDAWLASRKLNDGQEWGPWRLDAENMTLDFESKLVAVDRDADGELIMGRRESYYIMLADMKSAKGVLDWIGQIASKGWGPAAVGYLVEALDDIFDLQSTYGHGEGFADQEAVFQHITAITRTPAAVTACTV